MESWSWGVAMIKLFESIIVCGLFILTKGCITGGTLVFSGWELGNLVVSVYVGEIEELVACVVFLGVG